MKIGWVLFLLMIVTAVPPLVLGQESPTFFLFDYFLPVDDQTSGSDVNQEKIAEKVLRDMGVDIGEAKKHLIKDDGKYPADFVIPTEMNNKSINPKPGQKLWAFYKSKKLGVVKVTKVYVYFGEASQVFEPGFDVEENQVIKDLYWRKIFVSVPEGTLPKDFPREAKVSRAICQKLLKQISTQYPNAVVSQTLYAMGAKYIVVDSKPDENSLVRVAYKVVKNGFKKIAESSIELD